MNLYPDTHHLTDDQIIALTRSWVELVVIGLNLCPFAKAPHVKGRIHYAVSGAADVHGLTLEVEAQLQALHNTPATELETSLLIVLVFFMVLAGIAIRMLKSGYKLRH